MKRIYNFNAGPAMLPLEVLQEYRPSCWICRAAVCRFWK